MIYLFMYLSIITFTFYSFKSFGLKIAGQNSNPIALFFLLHLFLISLPGIMIVASGDFETTLNYGSMSVSEEIIDYVSLSYFYSIIILWIFIFLSCLIFRGFNLKNEILLDEDSSSKIDTFLVFSTFFNFLYLFALFMMIGLNNIPVMHFFYGNLEEIQLLKAKLITGEISKLPETINQIFRILIPLTCYISFYKLISSSDSRIKFIFILSFLAAFIFYFYEFQRAPFFVFLSGIFFLYMFKYGLKLKILFLFPIIFLILTILNGYYLGLPFDDFYLLIGKVLERIIIIQNVGFYYIVENITPDLVYLKNGMILSSVIFDKLPESPDAIVMNMIYGYSPVNVNMNTYFLGQAFAIAGTLGIIISPFIVWLQLVFSLVLFKFLYSKSKIFFVPLSIIFYLYFFPVNQGFNTFLYLRNFIFFVFFSSIIYFFWFIITSPKKLK